MVVVGGRDASPLPEGRRGVPKPGVARAPWRGAHLEARAIARANKLIHINGLAVCAAESVSARACTRHVGLGCPLGTGGCLS